MEVGLSIGYDQEKASGTKTVEVLNPKPPYDWITTTYRQTNKEAWFFLSPQVGYDYIKHENFRLGSLIGLSMVLINREDFTDLIRSKETDLNMIFHVEAISFSWGKTNGLTGQLGYGHKGLVGLGYFVRW